MTSDVEPLADKILSSQAARQCVADVFTIHVKLTSVIRYKNTIPSHKCKQRKSKLLFVFFVIL